MRDVEHLDPKVQDPTLKAKSEVSKDTMLNTFKDLRR